MKNLLRILGWGGLLLVEIGLLSSIHTYYASNDVTVLATGIFMLGDGLLVWAFEHDSVILGGF